MAEKSKNNSKRISNFKNMKTEERIMFVAGGMQLPEGKPGNEVLNSIFENDKTKEKRRFLFSPAIRAAAAVFIVLVLAFTVYYTISREKTITAYGEQAEVVLPDGTNVVLNAGSEVVWINQPFSSNRKIKLHGEAFLDVKKGENFLIKTNNGSVRILGTQLNVLSRENRFKVSCIEGKVSVTVNTREQILTPGEQAELTKNGLIKQQINNIQSVILWKAGISHFENATLVSIFAELERQYDISVEFNGNGKRLATVDFSNENLKEALEVICIPMGLEYEIRNNRKVIISEIE